MLGPALHPVPLLLGIVLGDMVASNYHRALLISGGTYGIFYASIIAKFLMFFTLLSLFFPLIAPAWNRFRGTVKKQQTF
jgi:putative tricarboxylic transport membrane protein